MSAVLLGRLGNVKLANRLGTDHLRLHARDVDFLSRRVEMSVWRSLRTPMGPKLKPDAMNQKLLCNKDNIECDTSSN